MEQFDMVLESIRQLRDDMNKRFDSVESRMTKMNESFVPRSELEAKLETIEERQKTQIEKLQARFYYLALTTLAGVLLWVVNTFQIFKK